MIQEGNRLQIEDISKLKITKIKNWAIYFTYDNDKYLSHESNEDYETSTVLYKREPMNSFGKFKLIDLGGEYGRKIPCINYKSQKRIKKYESRTLNQINIEDFVWDMTWFGFFKGIYAKEVEIRKEEINSINKAIQALNTQMYRLRRNN